MGELADEQQVTGDRDGVPSLLPIEECVRYYPPDLASVAEADDIFRNTAGPQVSREYDLFVDVPFCKTICGFCPFNVYPYERGLAREYLEAIAAEIREIKRRHDFSGKTVRTVWIGGGTPAILEESLLAELLDLVADSFDLSGTTELTVEVKPDMSNLTGAKIAMLKGRGVRRISMGVQSTDQGQLRTLGRGHTGQEALDVARFIKEAGFALNIDMMYRLPGQSVSAMAEDIEAIAALRLDHVSWFPYVAHEGTSLASRIERGRVQQQAGREDYLTMFLTLEQQMRELGFDQYTPYHFAGTDRCHYHVGRWQMPQRDTLGLGPGAFSFFNGWIYTNEHAPPRYAKAVRDGHPPVLMAKQLTPRELTTRLAVLGIKFFRLEEDAFRRSTGESLNDYYAAELSLLQRAGLVTVDGDVVCTKRGRAFNNDIATVFSTDTARRTRHPQGIELMRRG